MRKILLLLVTFITIGCESETSSVSTTPPGDIKGFVELRDTVNQTALRPDGVTISLEGTSFRTTSDSTGSWTLRDVPVGTYILVFEKQGFGMKKTYNLQHTANGTLYLHTQTLRQLPQISLDLVLRGFEDDRTIFTGLLSSGLFKYANGPHLRIGLYCSRNTAIDPLVESSFDATFSSSYYLSDSIGHSIGVYKSTLLNYGYKPGDRVYVIAVPILVVNYSDYGYYDYARQKSIVTGFGLNYSPVYSFVLP